MPTLLSLPAELHLKIIEETDLYDLEALWTSCKTFYAYGDDKLRLHTYRKAKFHTITVGWDPSSQFHPLLDLRDVLEDEEIGLFPRVMHINSLEFWDPHEDGDEYPSLAEQRESEIDNIIEEHGDRIDKLVAEIHRKLLPNAPTVDATDWSNGILSEKSAATTVLLLLTLYPHLEYLHIYDQYQDCWSADLVALSTSLTAAASDPITNTLGIFSKLSNLTLTGGPVLQSKVELLSPFMAVSAMRSIEAYKVSGRNVQWPRRIGFSQVTDVKLEMCDIDTATLTSHISAFKTLATLKYTFYPTPDYDEAYPSRWEPRAIVASLRLYAYDTLTILELTAADLTEILPYKNDEPYIGSLRAFKVLRSVKLDTMMLYERIKPASSVALEPRQKDLRSHEKQARAQPLVDFLPASVQRFHTTSRTVGKGPSKKDVGAMFKGLPDLSTRYLPRLEEICVEYKDESDDVEQEGRLELRSRCKEAGIKVESIKWSGGTGQTSWMA